MTKVVLEHAEQRLEDEAGYAVIAAGDVGAEIAELLQHDGGGKRKHQQGQAAVPQQEPAGNKPDQSSQDSGGEQPADRLGPAESGSSERHRIGTDAEEGGVPQRDDAAVAENKIEREREQHHHQHLRAEGQAVGEGEEGGDGDQPGQHFSVVKTVPFD